MSPPKVPSLFLGPSSVPGNLEPWWSAEKPKRARVRGQPRFQSEILSQKLITWAVQGLARKMWGPTLSSVPIPSSRVSFTAGPNTHRENSRRAACHDPAHSTTRDSLEATWRSLSRSVCGPCSVGPQASRFSSVLSHLWPSSHPTPCPLSPDPHNLLQASTLSHPTLASTVARVCGSGAAGRCCTVMEREPSWAGCTSRHPGPQEGGAEGLRVQAQLPGNLET